MPCCFNARFGSSTVNSNATGGHAATTTCNGLSAEADPTFANYDSPIPNTNADHATHRPRSRPARRRFHNSTVAIANNPSTNNGQIDAVDTSAPNRRANSRPWRYDAYAAPTATRSVQPHCTHRARFGATRSRCPPITTAPPPHDRAPAKTAKLSVVDRSAEPGTCEPEGSPSAQKLDDKPRHHPTPATPRAEENDPARHHATPPEP
ncbi:hypothetical protein GCM10027360_01750 [Amycolatopsis echigonensis]